MWTSTALRERLRRGHLVLDGALGTELERRGHATPAPLWSASVLLSDPQAVRAIHADYVAAGVEILVANTFRTNPRTLRAADRLADGPRLNRLAIELAREAVVTADRPVIVAASVGPVADCYQTDLVPTADELAIEHAQLADWLRSAEPDLVWIETMGTVREAVAASAAAQAAELPAVVSLLLREDGALLSGEALANAVTVVSVYEPLALGLNCIPPRGLTEWLPRLRDLTELPLVAYAHINNAVPLPGWSYAEQTTPAEYAEYARQWFDAGVSVVGGCCGTTPAHIHALV